MPELEPVRPVHPAWPGRRVPEEGDQPRRQRPLPGAGAEPGPRDEGGLQQDERRPAEPDPGQREPDRPATGGPGHHLDEYA